MPLIPFSWLPASWGLSGPARAEAEARYTLNGEALDRRLAEIQFENDPTALALANNDLDEKWLKVNSYEHDKRAVEIKHPEGAERDLALIDVEEKHEKITKLEAEKRRATLKDEPWIGIVDHGFDLEQGLDGVFFEFDWNEQWIGYLRLNGYEGITEEQVVERWFSDVCRSQLTIELEDA